MSIDPSTAAQEQHRTVESPVLTVVPWERAGRPMGQHRSTGEMELCPPPTISFFGIVLSPPFFPFFS